MVVLYEDYYFNNIIQNFPSSFEYISDINILRNKIYIATNNGIFSASINNNLLISNNWTHMFEGVYVISINDDSVRGFLNNNLDGGINCFFLIVLLLSL